MLSLRDLQVDFCRSITGATPGELLQLVSGDGIYPSARLSIYRNNVVSRLSDVLTATYPVVCKLVDRRFFAYAADKYIRQHLPTEACLLEYGEDFPSFLAEFTPAAKLNYLPDVARLEWTIHRAFRAERLPPISIASLAGLGGDPAQIRLSIANSTKFVASSYAIDQIWIAHQAVDLRADLRLRSTGAHLQVSAREGLCIVELPPAIWEFRSRLADGETLGAALVMARTMSADFDPAPALANLFDDGLVVGLTADSWHSKS